MENKKDSKQVRVLIVDDSATSRQTMRKVLQKLPEITIVGAAIDGYDGMAKIEEYSPDVITLDLEMPKLDGFALLRWVMEKKPTPVIVVSSHGDANYVFKALELGAVDFVVKPDYKIAESLLEFENNILTKISGIKSLNIEKYKSTLESIKGSGITHLFDYYEPVVKVEKETTRKVQIIVIGASTGGPTAVQAILTSLPNDFPCAIVIGQHMPAGFTRQFAERMNKLSTLEVKEAEKNDTVEAGKVLVCPGGCHTRLRKIHKRISVEIMDYGTDDKYIPSIDMMMKSAAAIYGASTMGILLTGMGNDGKDGMLEIKRLGGHTVVESEETAVVFGMPHSVIASRGADEVLPLYKIPEAILRALKMSH